jgi:hypothetical protein
MLATVVERVQKILFPVATSVPCDPEGYGAAARLEGVLL